ncbi:MAG: hypothetical protein J6N15_00125 [Ruminiclostridium sp.]|nr:hypothetical protein [Ruminiclostridium sp.]
MSYGRVEPRARSGTTGISVETDLDATEGAAGCWINPPDRVAAITCAVHKQRGYDGEIKFKIECCCNRADTIGSDGTGGYWDLIDAEHPSYSDDKVVMLANSVTGLRVTCLAGKINVCFVG